MSPELRERRIAAALEATHLTRRTIERALDAADRAVPVVPVIELARHPEYSEERPYRRRGHDPGPTTQGA